MHTLTVTTRFTFGDRVRFDSRVQRRAGTGTVVAIVSYAEGPIDYMIEVDGENDIQGGILEDEIAYLDPQRDAIGPDATIIG